MLHITQISAQYCNQYDKYHSFRCPSGQAVYRVRGYHNNGKEDRIYCWYCQSQNGSYSSCYNTGYINYFDQPVYFSCKVNYFLAGVRSYHDNKREDRRFDFTCCSINKRCITDCHDSNWVNSYDGYMNFYAPGRVIVGAYSRHDNKKE